MAIAGTLGARLYVSSTALANTEAAADAIGDFSGLTYANEVGLIESMGEFGKLYDLASFQAVGDGRMRKLRGGFNEGNLALVCGLNLSDAGQAKLKTYAEAADQNAYPIKLTIVTESGTDTYYFGVKVMSFRTVLGSVNNVVKVNISMEITTPVFTDAS